jgi:hypothetical protein
MDQSEPRPLPSDALLAGLAARAGELSTAAEHLREAYRFSRVLKAVVGVAVVVLVGIVVIAVLQLRVSSENRRTGQLIAGCTTPGGKCYERGQAQTASAVAAIVALIDERVRTDLAAAHACAAAHTDAAFAACMARKLPAPRLP